MYIPTKRLYESSGWQDELVYKGICCQSNLYDQSSVTVAHDASLLKVVL